MAAWIPYLLLVAILTFYLRQLLQPTRQPSLVTTICRLLCCRGMRLKGHLTGVIFPIHPDELTPTAMTAMLRHGGNLPSNWKVSQVTNRLTQIRDGVKVSTRPWEEFTRLSDV